MRAWRATHGPFLAAAIQIDSATRAARGSPSACVKSAGI
jgi:hypothetical protein